jgi:glycosyltransferase involved in cell wall biosynthesis
MEKLLIFFTTSYPNVNGEIFIENEIKIIEKYFTQIIIICASPKNNRVFRYQPNNSKVFFFSENLSFFQKLTGLRLIFKKEFRDEIAYARKNLNIKFNLLKYKILIIDLTKGYLLSRYAKKITKSHSNSSTYYYSYWSDYNAVACAFLKKEKPQVKAFARNHRWDIYFYANAHKYLPLRKFIFDNLDAVYSIADDGVDYLKNELNFKQTVFSVSKLGTYNNFESKSYSDSNILSIVSCSNLIAVKRVDLIIDVLELIFDFKVNWIHFGDGLLRESIIIRSAKLIDKDNIKFEFKGQTSNDDIMKFYNKNQVDLFINVSSSEGIPVSIMEAISFGIPVIATAVGGSPEIVKDSYNGFLLSQNPEPKEVLKSITNFYNLTVEQKSVLRQNAFNTWNKEYNAEKNYTEFAEKILSL